MRVLSFPSFSKNRTPAQGKDWSQQEIADFYRAHRLLVENGAAIGIDRGLTDIGEPWIVFYDLSTQDVFLHVARIDDHCVLICEALGIRLQASGISDLILCFETAVRDHISVQAERQGNVILHPAARIIMSISAIFLLSKIEGTGQAHAAEVGAAEAGVAETGAAQAAHAAGDAQQPGDADADAKKADAGAPLARAQTALARLFDTVESPRAVASLAGAILTGELLVNLQPVREEAELAAHASSEAESGGADMAHEPRVAAENGDAVALAAHEGRAHEASAAVVEQHDAALQVAGGQMQIMLEGGEVASGHETAFYVVPTAGRTVQVPAVEVTADGAVPGNLVASAAPEQVSTSGQMKAVPQALEALQSALGRALDFDGGSVQVAATGQPVNTVAPEFEISLATLGQIDASLGFYRETSFSDMDLHAALNHFLASMSGYEIEYVGGRVLIEQQDTVSLGFDEIGLWTNVLRDGSTISVIGQASLIDDIGMLVA